jgi:CheY-like chemotaxis protein
MAAEKHIWIIDDDPVFRMIFAMMLSRISDTIRCHECEHGRVFLNGFNGHATDGGHEGAYVFLDLNMPVANGWDVLRELQASGKDKNLTIYMLSSSINPEDEANAASFSNCQGFLVKPIDESQLRGLLQIS